MFHSHRKYEAEFLVSTGSLPNMSALWDCHIQIKKWDWIGSLDPDNRWPWVQASGILFLFWHKLEIVINVEECDKYEVLWILPWNCLTGYSQRRSKATDSAHIVL